MAYEQITVDSSHRESNETSDHIFRLHNVRSFAVDGSHRESNETSDHIFRLHKVRSYDEKYFFPRLVSIGPYHFKNPELDNMEKEKKVAMLRMEKRIQKSFDLTMELIVESYILPMEQKIRDFYADEIPFSGIELARMITSDSCFIFELMLNFPRCTQQKERSDEEMEVSVKHSNIFDGCSVTPTLQNLLVDCFLFENQIPVFVLERLVELKTGSKVSAEKELVEMMDELTKYFWFPPFTWRIEEGCRGASHLLEALYFETLGNNQSLSKQAYDLKQSTCLQKDAGWINNIFRKCSHWMRNLGLGFLLQSSSGEDISPSLTTISPSLTTIQRAVELNKIGVRFHAVTFEEIKAGGYDSGEDRAGVMSIRFDPKTSTLYLPKMTTGPYDEYIIRNFIALENSSDKYYFKAMTVFLKFMDELIDNEEDVALLVKRGVIDNVLGSNEEVAQLFNSVAKEYRYLEGFKPIDDAKKGLKIYERRKCKILWKEFVEAYFSKPWLVAISIGSMLLLLLTIVQVVCLFSTCEK